MGEEQFARNWHKVHFVLLPPDTIIKITAEANSPVQFFTWSMLEEQPSFLNNDVCLPVNAVWSERG